jgi:hypothetical protein
VVAWVRHGVALVAGFIAGTRGISAITGWRAWHDLASRDPSGAELYRTATILDLGIAAVSLALAGLAWWLLRPPRAAPHS